MIHRSRHLANRMATLLGRLLHGDAGAGVILILAALAAMVAANSPWAAPYHHLFHAPLAATPLARLDTLHAWVNDALMAVFFFVVGLEIKREVLDGALSTPQRRRLPVIAAIAGMAVPALLYMAIAGHLPPLRSGWAIPAATDIAFAVGVLGLLGKRAPPSLRLFLLTVAIVDDLGAVAIIAAFYTAQIDLVWLAVAAGLLGALVILNRSGVRRGIDCGWAYALLAMALWAAVLHSGIHATVAGVLAAFCVPLRLDRNGDSLLLRMEHALVPWNGYLIVPLFGFANAGVHFGGMHMADLLAPLPLAVMAGLFLGKQAGIFAAIAASDRLGIAARPAGATWPQLWGLSLLCGIGFTMSLFIGALAFPDAPHLVDEAKIGVLGGSLLSALLGYGVLRLAARR